jgi:hypothetical protein
MIYKVFSYNDIPTFFVTQDVYEANKDYEHALLVVGGLEDAELLLLKKQQETLINETSRFSICVSFVVGNNTIWRQIQEDDPNSTICQVFNHVSGAYTEVLSKSAANDLNEQYKKEFLESIGLDKVYALDAIPVIQPYLGSKYGATVGTIPVEVM